MSEKTNEYRVTLESIKNSRVYESKIMHLTEKEGQSLVDDFTMGGLRFSMELKDGRLLCLSARQMKYFAASLRKIDGIINH